MAFSIQGFGQNAPFQGVPSSFGGGFAPGGLPCASASASAFQTQQTLSTLLGALQQLQGAYVGILGSSQPFPGQPSFGSGNGFFPGQPSFGSGNGFFPGQPSFGSGNGFFPGQPDFGFGNGFSNQQPNSFNELLLQIAQANGVGGSQQTQTNGQTGQPLPVNVTARAYFDENQKLQQVQTINIWELNGSNENTFNTFGSNEVSARFNNGVQGRVYKIEVTWADGRRFQIEGVNTTGNVVIDRPNR